MAREWPVNHLRDEMKYFREVRDSLEKVREKMYGQFGGMQQSVEKLSREIKAANSHRRNLESEVRVRTAALDNFDQMNSNLISANIGLQKTLLESCHDRVGTREALRSVRGSQERAEERLREKERQLAAAQDENRTLKRQVEVSQEASAQALKDMSAKLQQQYDQRLQEEQRKHREEIEALQAQIDVYVKRIEELEKNARIAEAKIAEREQRVSELERLMDCMGVEKNQLMQKLRDTEHRLQQLDQVDHREPTVTKRAEQLQEEVSELRERIKHLNDMVFCQQRKVKGMIEEVEQLRSKVAQKDMFISELLDRLAIVECESNELEDKLKYFMSVQNTSEKDKPHSRDIGVACDFPVARSDPPPPPPPQQEFQPLQSYTPRPAPLPRPAWTGPLASSSRLSNSLLRFSPGQYSHYLHNSPSILRDETDSSTLSRSSTGVQTSSTVSPSPEDPPSFSYSPIARTAPSQVYTPFMKLMEISSKLNIE
ncbi:myocardial zonula adherens protein isoform X2 [Clupea harengus]|nr:myocardial zonula adherens protein isoform X2 [Clupea harengus]